MTRSTLTETEKRLCEISEMLLGLVSVVGLNGAIAFTIARQAGVKLPYGIEVINNDMKHIRNQIRAMIRPIVDPEGKAEREEPRDEIYTAVSYEGRPVYMAESKPESKS